MRWLSIGLRGLRLTKDSSARESGEMDMSVRSRSKPVEAEHSMRVTG